MAGLTPDSIPAGLACARLRASKGPLRAPSISGAGRLAAGSGIRTHIRRHPADSGEKQASFPCLSAENAA